MTSLTKKYWWYASARLRMWNFARVGVQWYPYFPDRVPMRQAVISITPYEWAIPLYVAWRRESWLHVRVLCINFETW